MSSLNLSGDAAPGVPLCGPAHPSKYTGRPFQGNPDGQISGILLKNSNEEVVSTRGGCASLTEFSEPPPLRNSTP